MRRRLIVALAVLSALSLVTYAQQTRSVAAPPQPPVGGNAQAARVANPTAVALGQGVITLKGGCLPIGTLQPAKDCVTSVTREQFEKVTNARQADLPAEAERNFAINHGRLLEFSDAARALHLENDPNVQLLLQFVTLQVLADGVRRHYTEEFAHPTEKQVQTYYDQNSGKYREATLQRIVIPRNPSAEDKPKPSEAEWIAAADTLRQQWVAGGDPANLQQAAFEAAGITGAGTPEVPLRARRPGSLPVDQESVFQLKAGKVSPVFTDAAAAYIYKVVSSRRDPLGEEKESIIKALQKQGLQDKLEEISKSATPELNEQYFGTSPPPPTGQGIPGRPGSGAQPQANHPPQ